MKLALFDDFKLGVIKGDSVVDVSAVVRDIPRLGPQDLMNALIEQFEGYRGKLQKAADAGRGVPIAEVKLRPPLPRPGNIVCMAVNYLEGKPSSTAAPINAFNKPSSSVIGDGDAMVCPDLPAASFEGEAELGVVFGKTGKNISEADAYDHVFGYLNFIDGSARGLGPKNNVYYRMKTLDTFCPIGPYLVTKDEVPDPQKLQVRLWNNKVLKQDYNTDDMAYSIRKCIAWVSGFHKVEAGDILAMGTNHGGLHPFQDGDKIELEVDGLGRLHIDVRDDLKRTWARETRSERVAAGHSGMEALRAPQLTGKYAKETGA
jgi:2-keto-4-pentenoate hydratase/2-oxohepta-3-ene-1,7-dioic acid hydratase in catechol pathway